MPRGQVFGIAGKQSMIFDQEVRVGVAFEGWGVVVEVGGQSAAAGQGDGGVAPGAFAGWYISLRS